MKKLITIFLINLSLFANANSDSTKVDTSKVKHSFYEITLSSRNVWRGVDFGNYSPSALGLVGVNFNKFEVGAYGITSITGTNVGYGNTFNVYATFKHKWFSATLEDYYFNGDVTNIKTNFFDWEKTHFLEGRLKFEHKGFQLVSGYTISGGKLYNIVSDTINNTKAVYIELGYKGEHWSFLAGGITSPSALNFHDAAGVTNISIKYKDKFEKLKNIPFEIGVYYNPNFDNISPKGFVRYGYGNNAFNFSIAITLI